ncbi:MAG: lipocalin-like domain-containing protein [Rhizomicrobium sp.]
MIIHFFRRMAVSALFLGTIFACDARADEFSLTGTWTLQSMVFVDEATGKATKDFGEHPKGYSIYAPGGYLSVVINAEGRQPVSATSDHAAEQRAQLLTSMVAHAGPYRFSDGKMVLKIEVAQDPRAVGTELIRFIKVIDNNQLEAATPITDLGNGKRVKIVLTWHRVA